MQMPVGAGRMIRFVIPHLKLLGPDVFVKSEFYKEVVAFMCFVCV